MRGDGGGEEEGGEEGGGGGGVRRWRGGRWRRERGERKGQSISLQVLRRVTLQLGCNA